MAQAESVGLPDRCELVLLPGMDGTGRLLLDWARLARPWFRSVRVIDYPLRQRLGYGGLLDHVRERLPQADDYLLLGESFSGPIALAVAAEQPSGLRGLVLSTTFARRPVPLPRVLGRRLPAFPSRWLPMPLLSALLLGRWSTPELRDELRAALNEVADEVLGHRAREAFCVDYCGLLGKIEIPVLYLRASQDRLVPARALAPLRFGLSRITTEVIEGPHLLLQTRPQEALSALLRWRQARAGA